MATLEGIIREPVKRPFRHVSIKRRSASTGLYESSWFDITDYVEKYGTLQTSLDDTRLNTFVHSGVQITVRNDHGEFNPETEGGSLFYGYLTRVRSLLKIEAGYTDGAGNSFPTDPSQGVFIMTGDINIVSQNNQVILNCNSLNNVFQEARADEIPGIYDGSLTASEIFGRIRDATDGSNNYLFRNFITSTAWSIQTTTTIYTGINTTTAVEDLSVWELMNKLAEVENFVVYITRFGGVNFQNRLPNTTSSMFSFYGAGYRSPNIIKLNSYKEAVDKLYTHVRFKFAKDDTSTSYIESGTTTTVSATSEEWKYGRRTYEFENTFFTSTDTAQNVATVLVNNFRNLVSELDMDCEFIPHLEILDPINVSYREGSLDSVHLWDAKNWAADTSISDTVYSLIWATETSSTIDFSQKAFKIISRRTNLDNFVTSFRLREVEG